ncbi:1,4-alpha-glucan branching protein domain-containing protein [Paenibacillus sp. SYP-B3998]|uniref:1,4-alpha-glucan branching protein domain-containing protein n=1 Tax=Paenibacillus sp. SYP-B3998 TaxID=2678564 RepID=UPI001F079DE8|nr:1,4-alpha-glucan branching protein domain-containing protein [Paenibacillus sp. SYP-B3998]
MKYHRVTDTATGSDKAPYHPERAAQKAQQHAEHFVAARVTQLRRLASESEAWHTAAGERQPQASEPPIIVCPYDAELFGHWWYEGPQWLEAVLRGFDAARSSSSDVVVSTTTLGDYATAHAPTTEAELPVSSWGRGGYAEVWLQPRSQWVQPQLHAAEDRMILAARKYRDDSLLSVWQKRMLNQAARELMLAQSSDWTFILDAGTVTAYAEHRIKTHLEQCHLLLEHIDNSADNHSEYLSETLNRLERRSPVLRQISYQFYKEYNEHAFSLQEDFQESSQASADKILQASSQHSLARNKPLRILMLVWEYPPRVIGGLARAVCDLSKQLTLSGHTVHVITCHAPDSPSYEISDGVHIHRVQVLQSIQAINFLDWVFQMNMAFTDTILRLSQQNVAFDIVHAHDWLVVYAAKESKQMLGLPLLATIHATEFGRNQGNLEGDIQQRIHELEAKLTREADQIIACSLYMQAEVCQLFKLPICKVTRIPNGIESYRKPEPYSKTANPLLLLAISEAAGQDRIICFLGRLVHEKGVHILIAAMRLVLKRFPTAKLVIAGAGPAQDSLQLQAEHLGDRVYFTGFLDEDDKQMLLQAAEFCVFPSLYEPFGLVALEAMASRTPLIVSDIGGLAEIVEHGIDGCKVPADDVNALAWKMAEWLEHPELGDQLIEVAAAKVLTVFNWRDICDSTTAVYSEVMNRWVPNSGIFPSQQEIIK